MHTEQRLSYYDKINFVSSVLLFDCVVFVPILDFHAILLVCHLRFSIFVPLCRFRFRATLSCFRGPFCRFLYFRVTVVFVIFLLFYVLFHFRAPLFYRHVVWVKQE